MPVALYTIDFNAEDDGDGTGTPTTDTVTLTLNVRDANGAPEVTHDRQSNRRDR